MGTACRALMNGSWDGRGGERGGRAVGCWAGVMFTPISAGTCRFGAVPGGFGSAAPHTRRSQQKPGSSSAPLRSRAKNPGDGPEWVRGLRTASGPRSPPKISGVPRGRSAAPPHKCRAPTGTRAPRGTPSHPRPPGAPHARPIGAGGAWIPPSASPPRAACARARAAGEPRVRAAAAAAAQCAAERVVRGSGCPWGCPWGCGAVRRSVGAGLAPGPGGGKKGALHGHGQGGGQRAPGSGGSGPRPAWEMQWGLPGGWEGRGGYRGFPGTGGVA